MTMVAMNTPCCGWPVHVFPAATDVFCPECDRHVDKRTGREYPVQAARRRVEWSSPLAGWGRY